jgi:hypothetical protein
MIAETIPRLRLMSNPVNLLCPLIASFPTWAGAVVVFYALATYGRAALNFRSFLRSFTS